MKSSDIIMTLEKHRRLIERGKAGFATPFEMALSKAHCDMMVKYYDKRRMVLVEKDFTVIKND